MSENEAALEQERSKLRELLARALANVDAEAFRQIIGHQIAVYIHDNYETKKIIDAAIEPVVREMARELAKDPVLMEQLQARVKSQMYAIAAGVTLKEPARY